MAKRSAQARYLSDVLSDWAGVVVTVEWESTGVGKGDWWVRWVDGPSTTALRAQAQEQARWVRPLDVDTLRWGPMHTPLAWALALADTATANPAVSDWAELAGLAEAHLHEADWPARTHDQAAITAATELARRGQGAELDMAKLLLESRTPPAVTKQRDKMITLPNHCRRCGSPIAGATATGVARGRPARWCSPACRVAAWRDRQPATKGRNETTCGRCGTPITVTSSTGRPARWCSPACRTAAWREQRR